MNGSRGRIRNCWALLRITTSVFIAAAILTSCTDTQVSSPDGADSAGWGPSIRFRVVASGLVEPWELTRDVDGHLWVTEKSGKRVVRIDPASGAKTVVATLSDVVASRAQDGLMGLTFRRGFPREHNDVFLAYTYDGDPGPAVQLRAKVVRYAYDPATSTLNEPVELITDLPASTDHNSGRLLIGPDDKLYYSIGDQGNNQFEYFCRPIQAQALPTADDVQSSRWTTYQGKVLRMNTDGTVPQDNPVLAGVRSHIYSYGHRNAQGLTLGPGDRMFSAEHGPRSDDEINLLVPGGNYGWPHVSGFQDDQSYVYANWSASTAPQCAELVYDSFAVPPSVPQQLETSWRAENFTAPQKTLYTVPNGYDFQDGACGEQSYICWPSIAPSSIEYVPDGPGVFAGWRNSLLVTSLKNGSVYSLRLSQDGQWVQGDVVQYFKTTNRYRDLVVSADGRTVYVATDDDGQAGPEIGPPTDKLDNPGAILEFTVAE